MDKDSFIFNILKCNIVSKLWYPNNFLSVVNQSLHFVIMLTQTFQQENLGRTTELQLPPPGRLHHQLDCSKVSVISKAGTCFQQRVGNADQGVIDHRM